MHATVRNLQRFEGVNIMITTYVDLVMDWVTEKLFLKDFSPKILFGEKQCRDNFNLT
jgi:hypothetical protein